jgi:signal peptidase I
MNLKRPPHHTGERPSLELLEQEIQRVRYKRRYRSVLKSTIYALVTVAAVAVLVATLWLPVMQTYGSSMAPTLNNGEIIFSVKTGKPERGDIIAFYYNNKVLVKRVIALPGEWVDINEDGTVFINNRMLTEPYLTDRALGNADIDFPYQVPDGKYFVMGDHRSTSADSRHTAVGCIGSEQIVGKILFRVWPMDRFGPVG